MFHVVDNNLLIIRFKVINSSDKNIALDHSADTFIEKLEVLHAGNVLEQINSYGQLSAMLLDCQVDPKIRYRSLNATKGCCTVATSTAAYSTINTTNSAVYTITFISGIVGSLCRNYIPVSDLEGSLQIRVTLALATRVGKWSDAPNNGESSLTFDNIEFHANMIRL